MDSTGMLHFDQDCVNPDGCLCLRASVDGKGGQGRKQRSGERDPSCAL